MTRYLVCIRGGGVKSASAVGILQRMSELKMEVYGYSGTSIGAVVASLAAFGQSPENIRNLLEEWVGVFTKANRLKGGGGSSIIEKSVDAECGIM